MLRKIGYFLSFLSTVFIVSGVSTIAQTKPKIKGSDVLINGDSFFAMSNEIKKFLEEHARADGIIGQNESFRSEAVSGAVTSGIMNQYDKANPKPIYVIMDAGGNDCLMGNPNNCKNNVQPLLDKMAAAGTKKVLWMRYPDPQSGMVDANSLKRNLDNLMPEVEKICKASVNPKVLWVDLRPTWGTNRSYTSDGIHPTTAGAKATADAFWDAIKADNYAFFDTGTTSIPNYLVNNHNAAPFQIISQFVRNGNLSVSLSIDQPSDILFQLTTVSGRSVFTTQRYTSTSGKQTFELPAGSLAKGVYCTEIKAGKQSRQSTVYVP